MAAKWLTVDCGQSDLLTEAYDHRISDKNAEWAGGPFDMSALPSHRGLADFGTDSMNSTRSTISTQPVGFYHHSHWPVKAGGVAATYTMSKDARDPPYTESCNSAFKLTPSSSSATPPGHRPSFDSATVALRHARRPQLPHSLDAHPTHQSLEDFQFAIQTQSADISEASGLLLTDSMYVNYKPSPLEVSDRDGESIATEHEKRIQGNSGDSRSTSIDDSGEVANAGRARLDRVSECLEWGPDPNFGNSKTPYAPGLASATVESVYGFSLTALKSHQVGPYEDVALQRECEMIWNSRSRTTLIATDLIPKTPTMRTDPHRNRKDDAIKAYRHKRLKVLECPEQETDPTALRAKAMVRSTTRTTPKVDRRIRKRSKNDGLKHTKYLLTDEQRRQNHSTSEKRRRILINDYFDDLYALVPRLGRRRFGKSAVLELAREWIEELVEGNKVLEKQLSRLVGNETQKAI